MVFIALSLQLLLKLEDNLLIETVGIPVQEEKGITRLTACVSSQVNLTFVVVRNFSFFFFCIIDVLKLSALGWMSTALLVLCYWERRVFQKPSET